MSETGATNRKWHQLPSSRHWCSLRNASVSVAKGGAERRSGLEQAKRAEWVSHVQCPDWGPRVAILIARGKLRFFKREVADRRMSENGTEA